MPIILSSNSFPFMRGSVVNFIFYILYLLTGLERQAVYDPSHDQSNEFHWIRPADFSLQCSILI